MGVIVPGDTIALSNNPNSLLTTNIECLTDVVLANIGRLRPRICGDDPVGNALLRCLTADDAVLIETISRLARQSAYERLGLLMLELRDRLALVGLVDGTSFPMPLTQQALSETLGLSIVHVNRTLRQLRLDGMMEIAQRRARLLDVTALRHAVDYAPPPSLSRPRASGRGADRLVAVAGPMA